MWSSCNIYRALIHRWQVFFSATPLPFTKPEVPFFLSHLLFFFLMPFEFQRKPTTLIYLAEKGEGAVMMLSFPSTVYSASPISSFFTPSFFLHWLRLWCFLTRLLHFSDGKVGLNPESLRQDVTILLWRISLLKTSLNSSWCCKVSERLFAVGPSVMLLGRLCSCQAGFYRLLTLAQL